MSGSKATCPEAPREAIKPGCKKYRGRGSMRTGWSQEELPNILKKICSKYPGITYIEVNPNDIHWNFECKKEDLLPRKNESRLENPSKRKGRN